MVDELRAKQAEVDARRHFTKEGEHITDVRTLLAEWTEPEQADPVRAALATAGSLRIGAKDGFIEVG
jgi:hypothetical protein